MGAGLRKSVSACICTARSVSLLLALRFSAHGVVRCRRRSIVTAAHPTSPLSSSAPVLFFFYRLRAKRKKYHGLTTIGFSATSGMDRWPCSAGSSHQKWCLRRTECVVSSCGLAKLSVSVLLVSHVFLPARVSAVYIAGVW